MTIAPKLHRADPDELARTINELHVLIQDAVDGRNCLWRVRSLIDSIRNAEAIIAVTVTPEKKPSPTSAGPEQVPQKTGDKKPGLPSAESLKARGWVEAPNTGKGFTMPMGRPPK